MKWHLKVVGEISVIEIIRLNGLSSIGKRPTIVCSQYDTREVQIAAISRAERQVCQK